MVKRNKKIYAFIFARGGSKGLPNKNLKKLAGKPLIAWSIEQAKSVSMIDRVILSTDSDEIAEVGKKFGAEVLFKRPRNLSTDKSPEWLAWQHALNFLKKNEGFTPDIMVSVPPTSPLREKEDIEKCINKLLLDDLDIAITVSSSSRNPWFNMILENEKGLSELVMKNKKTFYRRQDAPKTYDITTVAYAAKTKYVLSKTSIFSGKVGHIIIPKIRAIDIDDMIDFNLAETLVKKNEKK
jgi:N-acylneuraminate cytidylyltransferase